MTSDCGVNQTELVDTTIVIMLNWLIKSDHLEIMLIVIVKSDYKGGVSTFLDPKKQLEMTKIVRTSCRAG